MEMGNNRPYFCFSDQAIKYFPWASGTTTPTASFEISIVREEYDQAFSGGNFFVLDFLKAEDDSWRSLKFVIHIFF
jgi:hypothetical protein